MPSDPARQSLCDIRDNIELARDFIGAEVFERFAMDRRTIYAVSRCLEIISEAARRLPSDVRDRHSYLPWRAIMDLGNAYRHEYHNIVEERIWRTVHEDLPRLAHAIDDEIDRACREGEAGG